ncbi:hypothetical protein ACH47C_15940 [Streptomyces rishiriensis]
MALRTGVTGDEGRQHPATGDTFAGGGRRAVQDGGPVGGPVGVVEEAA